jgi:hypothetical protein
LPGLCGRWGGLRISSSCQRDMYPPCTGPARAKRAGPSCFALTAGHRHHVVGSRQAPWRRQTRYRVGTPSRARSPDADRGGAFSLSQHNQRLGTFMACRGCDGGTDCARSRSRPLVGLARRIASGLLFSRPGDAGGLPHRQFHPVVGLLASFDPPQGGVPKAS